MERDGRTPPDHVVLALQIEAALLPGWFDEVQRIAARVVRRMMVVERPEAWTVRCELPRDRADEFVAALRRAWACSPFRYGPT